MCTRKSIYPKSFFFNVFFETLIITLATKQKLFPVDYDSGSMLKRKESKKNLILLDLLKKTHQKIPL